MRAARYHGNRDVRVEEIDEPDVRPGTVKVAVDWCGICGSDLHEFLHGPETIPAPGKPHPLSGETVPIVLGHEFAGRVVELGDGVEGYSLGDAVAIEPILRDNECPACLAGDYNLCEQLGFHGITGGGGLAEFTVVPSYMVHRLPNGVSTELGALVEPLAVGWHAVRHAGVERGQSTVVVGAGPIGLVTMLALRDAGAGFIALVEPTAARKAKAEQLGANLVLDPGTDDVVGILRDHTGGRGVDVAFDACGRQETIELALVSVRPHGTVANIALWAHPAEIDMMQMMFSEARLTCSLAYCQDHPAVLAALGTGTFDASALITRRIPLEEIVTRGIQELIDHADRNVKILVQP